MIDKNEEADENCNTREAEPIIKQNNNVEDCKTRELIRTLESDCSAESSIRPEIGRIFVQNFDI